MRVPKSSSLGQLIERGRSSRGGSWGTLRGEMLAFSHTDVPQEVPRCMRCRARDSCVLGGATRSRTCAIIDDHDSLVRLLGSGFCLLPTGGTGAQVGFVCCDANSLSFSGLLTPLTIRASRFSTAYLSDLAQSIFIMLGDLATGSRRILAERRVDAILDLHFSLPVTNWVNNNKLMALLAIMDLTLLGSSLDAYLLLSNLPTQHVGC
nr:hypothetical protein Iba_chr09bCG9200 [Ipomoea batatas]